jgi:hypothetical protein
MRAESIKGSLMLGAVVSVKRLRARGRVSPEALEAGLSAEALALVDQKIDISRWYPIQPFCELIDLDWEISGAREPAYLESQGAAAADRLFDSGIYQQLDFAQRSGKVESREKLVRQSRLITTITGTLYDFLTFEVNLAPESLEIVFGNAERFSDGLIHTTVGFMNRINERQGSKRRWRGWREAADRARFSMSLPTRLAD